MILGALVQKLIFQDGAGGHFGFGPLEKIAQQCKSCMDLILTEDISKIQNLQKNFVIPQFHGYLHIWGLVP